jgi:hypothetical protein
LELDLTFDQAPKIRALDRVALTHGPPMTFGNVRLGARGLNPQFVGLPTFMNANN